MRSRERFELKAINTSIEFLKKAIIADDPKKELILRCNDIYESIEKLTSPPTPSKQQ